MDTLRTAKGVQDNIGNIAATRQPAISAAEPDSTPLFCKLTALQTGINPAGDINDKVGCTSADSQLKTISCSGSDLWPGWSQEVPL